MKQIKSNLRAKILYASGDIFGGGAFLLINLLFLNYLTDIELIPPALASLIILIGKTWDGVWDPIMGIISDRTKSKFGKKRVYFLVGAVPIFISFSLLWYSFGISQAAGKFIYYIFVYILFSMIFSMVMIPYNSILTTMTKDYKERTSFTGIRMIFSAISAIAAGVVPKIIVNCFGANVKQGYLVMGVIFAFVYSLPWLLVFIGTFENEADGLINNNQIKFKEFLSVFKNKAFRSYAVIFLSGQAATDFISTLFIYYLTACLGRPKEFSAVLGVLLVTRVISMPFCTRISQKYKKTAPLSVGSAVWSIALICSLFLNSSSPNYIVYIIAIFSGFGTAASVLVPWTILPEVSDVDELIFNRRSEGIYAGIGTFFRKISNGLNIAVIGILIQVFGYITPSVSGQVVVQKTSTVMAIKLLFGIVPIIFIYISLYFAKKYNVTEEKYDIFTAEIQRRKNGGLADDVDEHTKKICEEVTGLDYTLLWKS